jgi:PAS domain S-box-containing protein
MKTKQGKRPVLSVLIVEDEKPALEFLSFMVAKQFPESIVYQAENGQRGLELFQEFHPDIVITDINMPVMDGIEMAGKIRALDAGVHIIAVTAKSDTQNLLDAIEIGIDRYLLKPIQIEKLFASMDHCIDRITLSRQLKAQNEYILKLSRAVEQSTNMIIIANSRGTVEFVNSRFTEVTGYRTEEATGQKLRMLMAGATSHDTFEMLWSTITRGFEWHGEFNYSKKVGEVFCVEASISPLAIEGAITTHFVVVMQDISERKLAEDYVRRLNDELDKRVKERTAELEASNRELESFCYSVSHDLRAPLRGMSGFSSMLEEDYSDKLDDAGKECVQRIRSAAVGMGQLIDGLLDLSRVTRCQLLREKVDLSALAHKIAATLGEQEPERGVDLVIPEEIMADGDPHLLGLVLTNLLGNAWKYTGKKSRPRVEFGSLVLDGQRVYFVADNGVGFDLAHASTLFKPFHRLHGAGEFAGHGIGLATVERIVTRHGGRIWAEGEVGKGATFYFTLK